MKATQGSLGRVFVLRLEDGDRMPACVEQFAAENNVNSAMCIMLGGLGGGNLVVGPEDGSAPAITPLLHEILDVGEAAAVGTLFPDAEGKPMLHMHAAVGRGEATHTGCIRPGVDVWRIAEVVILELTGLNLSRKLDPGLGVSVLGAD